MEKFETTIGMVDTGASGSDKHFGERHEGDAARFINREEALRELREIALKDSVDDMDGNEVERVRDIVEQCDPKDAMIFLRATEATGSLKSGSFEEGAIDFSEKALELLEEIRSRAESYLVRSKIDVTRQLPLDHWTVSQKRDLLERNWRYVSVYVVSGYPNLYEEYYASDPSIIQDISPEDVERLFWVYQKDCFALFEHESGWEMSQRFHGPDMLEKYDIPLPKNTDDIPEFEKRTRIFTGAGWVEEIPSEWGRIVGKVSDRYGIVYSTGFRVEFFFELDPEIENGISKEKQSVKRLTAEDVLQKEGFSGTSANAENELQNQASLYSILIQPAFRKKIEDDFGIELKDFSVRTQVQFLNFLFEKNEEEVKRVMKFVTGSKYRSHAFFLLEDDRRREENQDEVDPKNLFDPTVSANRLTSFLSLEQGGAEMGEKILVIGEKLPKEAADRVFAKYAEMAEVARGAAEYVEKSLKAPEKSSPEVIARVAETLLVRAKNMLVEFSEADTSEENDVHALFAKLDSFRADIELYKATLTAFARSGEPLGLDDMEQSRFEAVHAEALSDMDRGVMRDMYLRNIAGSPERVRAKLLENLDRNFENTDATFYVFRYENRVEGFLCFSQDQEGKARGEKFGSAFNVNPDFQKGTIGMMMHEEATNREAENFAIRIECLPEKRSSARYIESGFVGTRLWDDDGEMVLDAVRDDRKKENFHSKVLSREEIMTRDGGEERDGVLALSFERAEDIPFEQYVGSYALTRYFFDAQRNRWFLVFEKHETNEI